MQNKIKQLKEAFLTLGKEGYKLEINDNIASLYRISKRSKFGEKKEFAYRFKDQTAALKYCLDFYNNKVAIFDRQEESKRLQKIKKAEAAKNINVGDIFCYSWGWEQTNVDFYQVTEKKTDATIKVRPISYETVEEVSWGSDYVTPCANEFVGEEFSVRLNGDGFKRPCGYAHKVEEKNSKHYRSWYA